ncbi:Acid phosphatase type 7 [Frankliniella fusca]|uniref:Purple acid phosphatase n=1 Tax=Frankliniella fusca TaxID=407009 RepID=A0AAE1H4Z0_9NEOP|nr:Acid phosphatase type 7 [Frankliniella fusca]
MFVYFFLTGLVFTSILTESSATVRYQPEQIHLSFGEKERSIVITWSTGNKTDSIVKYGGGGQLLQTKAGSCSLFVDGGSKKASQYIHRVTLYYEEPDSLQPETKYYYHVGSDRGWSAIYWFMTPPENLNEWAPSIAIYGDMGNVNAQSLPRLQAETQAGNYDAIIHVGDFAYNMDDYDGEVGDEFMRQIETIAAYVPYMTTVGNHESAYNFSHYRARFSMPGPYENMMYSFNMGPIHFISFSTEYYYYLRYGFKMLVKQYEWLENDLKMANHPANRTIRPWIITLGHRPMYCSNKDDDDCTRIKNRLRYGITPLRLFALEDLFYKYSVDLEIWAHEHSYERLWPIYDYKVYNGSYDEPYTNPRAPVHIVVGSAGCQERVDSFNPLPSWSGFRSSDYGYSRVKVHNATHLNLQQVSDDLDGQVIDDWWLVKEMPRIKFPLADKLEEATKDTSQNHIRETVEINE